MIFIFHRNKERLSFSRIEYSWNPFFLIQNVFFVLICFSDSLFITFLPANNAFFNIFTFLDFPVCLHSQFVISLNGRCIPYFFDFLILFLFSWWIFNTFFSKWYWSDVWLTSCSWHFLIKKMITKFASDLCSVLFSFRDFSSSLVCTSTVLHLVSVGCHFIPSHCQPWRKNSHSRERHFY